MQVHPNDLAILNKTLPSSGPDTQKAGWAMAFLRVCKGLEEHLVLTDQERTEWLEGVGSLDFHLARVAAKTESVAHHIGVKRDTFIKLREIADKCWRGPSSHLRALPFIADAALRRIAERDLASLAVALKTEETKSGLLFAGSVVEAILLDLVEKDEAASKSTAAAIKTARQQKDPKRWGKFDANNIDSWTFYHLVVICGPNGLGILSNRAERIADTVRDSRNFVHPRKERDELGTANLLPSEAVIASGLAEIVIDEVGAWKGKNP